MREGSRYDLRSPMTYDRVKMLLAFDNCYDFPVLTIKNMKECAKVKVQEVLVKVCSTPSTSSVTKYYRNVKVLTATTILQDFKHNCSDCRTQ